MDTEGPCDDPGNPELLKDWDQVDKAMDKLFDDGFRFGYPDSDGNGLKFGWFFLTWTGFSTNPRNRDFGYHKVRDHYLENWGKELEKYGDEQCWHYHHPAESRIGNEWGLDWSLCQEFEQVISRQILERNWFPVCFRAGGTIMDNQSSRWVDTWFPVDYSNRAPLTIKGLVDWKEARDDWGLYHPDSENFTHAGNGNRIMARCLDLMTGEYVLDDEEIHKAFKNAAVGQETVLSVFDHDYRDIAERIESFCRNVSRIAAEYPQVKWQYSGPVEGVRNSVGIRTSNGLKINALLDNDRIHIWTSGEVFQHIPWIAVEDSAGDVIHCQENILKVSPTEWIWHIPETLEWKKVGIAASDYDGFSDCITVLPAEAPLRQFFEDSMSEHPRYPNHIEYHSKAFPSSCLERARELAVPMDAVMQAAELIEPYVEGPGTTLLDVGCASAQAWLTFRKFGLEYHGIDDFQTAIQIGKAYLPEKGLPARQLRCMELENLSSSETYDIVTNLFKFRYTPAFQKPLDILARTTGKLLVIRGIFGEKQEERYLPDVLLEPGYQSTCSYFNIYARKDIEEFLSNLGFKVSWVTDKRQQEKFNGQPEVVGGIPFVYEFLVAERVSAPPTEEERLGEYWKRHAEEALQKRDEGWGK